MPAGVNDEDQPSRAGIEFDVEEMHAAHLMSLVHAKTIGIDPLSDVCVVITGSHNFSVSASERNGENLAIVHGKSMHLPFDQNGHLLRGIVPSLEWNPTQSLDR
jgi:phosphatidylserine/phosphatidylglycerophosphate/cardiolipin synthase-like enzyme